MRWLCAEDDDAIFVDQAIWRAQDVPPLFAGPAPRLADAYVQMGCQPGFTSSPYLLDTAPRAGATIVWAEANAPVYANAVLGVRAAQRPDFWI